MLKSFFIRANVFGKIKYWEHIHGLHSGYGGAMGYDVFPSVEVANKTVTKLKNVFHSGIIWEVLPETELTRILCFANSTPIVFVIPINACLLVVYATRFSFVIVPNTEEIFTIRPYFLNIM